MTIEEKFDFKKRLLKTCADIINDRISHIVRAMDNAQLAANAEEKSSAGDKFGTGRAMSHLQKEMLAGQLAAQQTELANLLSISTDVLYKSPAKGGIVICDMYNFFIAAGLGKIIFEKKECYIISPAAPLAMIIKNQQAGDKFIFNKKEITVTAIF